MYELQIGTFLIMLMFFVAGINKIGNIEKTAISLKNQVSLDISFNLYIIAIVLVIILEILAPIIVMYYTYSKDNNYRTYAKNSIYGLIIFTLLATLIYHRNDKNIILSHLAVIGGMLLIDNNM